VEPPPVVGTVVPPIGYGFPRRGSQEGPSIGDAGDRHGIQTMSQPQDPLTAVRQVVIVDPLGLHLRPAERFVTLAQSFGSEVWVTCNGVKGNGKSILDLASLAAECGMTIEIKAHGPDAEVAVAALSELIKAGSEEGGETA
jgi:phosphocarrier protein